MRPNKDQYGMMLARTAAQRATCKKTSDMGAGCVLISPEGRVLATGYNGSMPGAEHCEEVGHLRLDGHCIRTVHAEANAVADAARRGTAVQGATAYCVLQPCKDCLKLLAAAGIVRVVYATVYEGEHGQAKQPAYLRLMFDSRINFEHMPWDVVDHRGKIDAKPWNIRLDETPDHQDINILVWESR